jgi:hypothetical protein
VWCRRPHMTQTRQYQTHYKSAPPAHITSHPPLHFAATPQTRPTTPATNPAQAYLPPFQHRHKQDYTQPSSQHAKEQGKSAHKSIFATALAWPASLKQRLTYDFRAARIDVGERTRTTTRSANSFSRRMVKVRCRQLCASGRSAQLTAARICTGDQDVGQRPT